MQRYRRSPQSSKSLLFSCSVTRQPSFRFSVDLVVHSFDFSFSSRFRRFLSFFFSRFSRFRFSSAVSVVELTCSVAASARISAILGRGVCLLSTGEVGVGDEAFSLVDDTPLSTADDF